MREAESTGSEGDQEPPRVLARVAGGLVTTEMRNAEVSGFGGG